MLLNLETIGEAQEGLNHFQEDMDSYANSKASQYSEVGSGISGNEGNEGKEFQDASGKVI